MLDSAGDYSIPWAVSKENLNIAKTGMSIFNIMNFY